MLTTVLFDLDGTLIKSVDLIIETYIEVMKSFDLDLELSKEEQTSFLGKPLIQGFGYHFTDQETIDEAIKRYRVISKEKNEKYLEAYPNAKEIINYLKNNQIKVGIVTSKSRQVATENLKQLALDQLFDVVITLEDTKEHKPSPEGLLLALEKLGSKSEESIYIGDHENDILAAKRANMLSCAVTYSYRLQEMLAHNPEYVIDELMNLEDII